MDKLEKLLEFVIPYYENDDPSHDMSHVRRVLRTCEVIGKELKANLDLLLPAAILHDIVNVPKNSPNRSKASELAANKAKTILKQFDYTDEKCLKIHQIIIEHSFSKGLSPSSLESKILQDSDKLDAIGAIGILRVSTCGTKMKAKYYNENDPWAKDRAYDDKKYSLDHFYTKLLKLPELMNTSIGREMASERVKFMQKFLDQLAQEI